MPVITEPVLELALQHEAKLSIEQMLIGRDKRLFEFFQTMVVRSPAPQVMAKAGCFVFLACDLQFKKSQLAFPQTLPRILNDVTREMLGDVEWEDTVAARMFTSQRPLHTVCREWCTKSAKPEAAKLGIATMFRVLDLHSDALQA
jgi:hypothetical protein